MGKIETALHTPVSRPARMLILILLTCLPLAVVLHQFDRATGFSGLIYFGERYQASATETLRAIPRVIYPGDGYDGQFYAELALDPLLRDPGIERALDTPTYRARRILLPAAAYVLGLGRPAAVIQAYALINGAFFVALLLGMYFRLRTASVRDFLLLGAAAWSTGVIVSVGRALVDLPAVTLLFYACLLPANLASVALCAAILTRETSLLSILAVAWPGAAGHADWRRMAEHALMVLAPFAAWLVIVHAAFQARGQFGLHNFTLPPVGLIRHVIETARLALGGQDLSALGELACTLSITAQAVYLLAHPRKESALWRMGVGFAALFFCLGDVVFVEQVAYTRVVLPMTLAFYGLLWDRRDGEMIRWYLLVTGGTVLDMVVNFPKIFG